VAAIDHREIHEEALIREEVVVDLFPGFAIVLVRTDGLTRFLFFDRSLLYLIASLHMHMHFTSLYLTFNLAALSMEWRYLGMAWPQLQFSGGRNGVMKQGFAH